MNKLLAVLACILLSMGFIALNKPTQAPVCGQNPTQQYPNPGLPHEVNPVAAYEGEPDEELKDVMVPIPMKDRVFNKTGIQCVWCSLETIGRYAEEPKLIGMTNLSDCKSYSSPSSAGNKLRQLKSAL